MSWTRALVASLLALSLPGAAHAAEPFTVTGHIQETRYMATGARIADGALLIAGSRQSYEPIASVERFSLATNQWTLTDSLETPRGYAGAVTLADGRVLVAGGQTRLVQGIATTEIYDPKTSTWTDGPEMTTGRTQLGLVRLDDGRLLATGGTTYGAGAETLDSTSGEWEPTGPVGASRYDAAVVKLKDGKVLVAGGWTSPGLDYTSRGIFQSTAEVFDPKTDTWSAVASMHLQRYLAEGALLPDGRVLVASGSDGTIGGVETDSNRTYEIYDPVANTWSAPKPLLGSRASADSLVTLSDGRLVLVGGHSGRTELESVDVFDPRTGTWTTSIPTGGGRSGAVALALPDDSVLMASGFGFDWSSRRINPNWTPPVTATPTPDPTPTPTPVTQPEVKPETKPAPGKATVTVAKTLKTSRTGVLSLKVSCAGASACPKQRLTLRLRGGKVLARTDVSLAAGASKTVRLTLKRADRRKRSLKVAVAFAGATYNRTLQVR